MASPYDDVPWADEPPPDDDVPPEDTEAPRRSPAARPGSSGHRVQDGLTVTTSSAPRGPATGPTSKNVAPATGMPALPLVRPADDEPSADDVDLDGSNLVGPKVVEQILGGVVIEDREE